MLLSLFSDRNISCGLESCHCASFGVSWQRYHVCWLVCRCDCCTCVFSIRHTALRLVWSWRQSTSATLFWYVLRPLPMSDQVSCWYILMAGRPVMTSGWTMTAQRSIRQAGAIVLDTSWCHHQVSFDWLNYITFLSYHFWVVDAQLEKIMIHLLAGKIDSIVTVAC